MSFYEDIEGGNNVAELNDGSDEYSDKSALIPGSSNSGKSYGTDIETSIAIEDRLVYSWKEIDVYGEQKVQAPFWTRMKKKFCSCFSSNGKEFVTRKHLLKNVTGVAYSGELLAVLGSSGAGKTTLMNALCFRSPSGIKVSSTTVRALNGVPVTSEKLRSHCAYVQQDDLFIPSLTCKEHLIFQAMLRMGRNVSYQQKLTRVNEVLNELSLRKCANTIIGSPGRIKGLSGGERKRLSFASETLTDPHLLLCDEPTSGLDSFMAHSVFMFDKILLIAEGRTAFLGSPSQATVFFDQLGIPCPVNYNPADYFVQILAIAPNREQECRTTIKKICDSFAVSAIAEEINSVATKLATDEDIANSQSNKIQRFRAPWLTQFYAITWRAWLSVLKEPMLVKVRLSQTIMVSLLIGIIFYGQILDQDGVMNINGALFLFLTNMTFQNVFSVINVFAAEQPLFIRESRARLYQSSAYFFGKTLAELPLFLLIPIIFTSICYPMIGLRAGWSYFFIAIGIVCLIANVSTSFGYLISCASSSISMALSIAPPVIIPFLIFGGFFLNAASVPGYFKWLSYFSWFRYGNEALMINQWDGIDDIMCTRNITCPTNGQVILETFNFTPSNFGWDIFALIFLIVILRFGAYLFLLSKSRSKE
ncbi:hypothetical protein PVAND_012524 [Polypedilum vanderplanki]|uniref:Protein white n=1 Tax=Polypedilum vanderplanki TaxID=319348 RepID=A0A9J6CMZ7_POLVA|nr:hypothetical protein PVAND_012524 [Polypedilum vanderplanki]